MLLQSYNKGTDDIFTILLQMIRMPMGFCFVFLSFPGDRISLCSPGCPRTHRSLCLSLPTAGTKGVHHHGPTGMLKVLKSQTVFVSKLRIKPNGSRKRGANVNTKIETQTLCEENKLWV